MGRIWSALLGAVALALLLLPASAAATQEMAVQPDGKIVLLGRIWPEAGALARLNPDGSLDPSFGEGGFVIDRRVPAFRALALQPDGRIVGAAVGGFNLARYLPDGAPDPSFAGSGIGGTDEPDQPHFPYGYVRGGYGPAAIVVRPDGTIIVAGTHEVNGAGASDGWVKRYDGGGALIENVGHVSLPGGPATDSGLTDLLEEADGSMVGTGWLYPGSPEEAQPLLAHFVPGSGADFDHSFGGGAGLVRPKFLSRPRFRTFVNALAGSGDKLLVAGGTGGTLLLARFNGDGTLDTSFGENGFSAPPIAGPGDAASKGAFEEASTWANDVAVIAGGGVILGGGTSQWSTWVVNKLSGPLCTDCPQPVLARFDASGHPDPSFGNGGLLRLLKPDGGTFLGEVEQVAPLADGKLLVAGTVPSSWTSVVPFVARLNSDGSYDPSFGEGGLVTPDFPCSNQLEAEKRRTGCIASARVSLRLGGLKRRHPVLRLRVRPSLSWAGIHALTLTLPKNLRLTPGFRSKLRLAGAGEDAEVHVIPPKHGRRTTSLLFQELGATSQLGVRLERGGLRVKGRLRHRKLTLKVGVNFLDSRWGTWAGDDTVARRAG